MEVLAEPVLKAYPTYEFEIQPPPSYVSFYSKTSNDLLLVYEKVNSMFSSVLNNF